MCVVPIYSQSRSLASLAPSHEVLQQIIFVHCSSALWELEPGNLRWVGRLSNLKKKPPSPSPSPTPAPKPPAPKPQLPPYPTSTEVRCPSLQIHVYDDAAHHGPAYSSNLSSPPLHYLLQMDNMQVSITIDDLSPLNKQLSVTASHAFMELTFTPLALPTLFSSPDDHILGPMDLTTAVLLRGAGNLLSVTGSIVPNKKMSPMVIHCDTLICTHADLFESEEVSPTIFASSNDFAIVVHEAQENEAPGTRHVSVTSNGTASLKWCGQLHWCAMAAVKMQSRTEKEIKRIINGGEPKPLSVRAPMYVTIKGMQEIDVSVIFSPTEIMSICTQSMTIDMADLPGRSKPDIKLHASATSIFTNDVHPDFLTLDSFTFNDTFRVATAAELAAYATKAEDCR